MLALLSPIRRRDAVPATEVVVDALAAYRITRLLITDTILDRPRSALRQFALRHQRNMLLELIGCPWCLGAYVAAGVVAARRAAPGLWQPVACVLAFSAVTGLLSETA